MNFGDCHYRCLPSRGDNRLLDRGLFLHRILIVFFFVGSSLPLSAEEARVEVATQQPPHYAGDPVVIQFTVEGFEEEPQPTCTVDTPSGELAAGLRGQMTASNPNVFSQIIQQNGQLYRSKRVTYQIQYLVTAEQPGEYQVGPFAIQQGSRVVKADAVSMSFQAVPLDPKMRVRLVLPDRPVYPDQRVPIDIEWWYAENLENVLKLSIYSPVFDQFHFAAAPPRTRGSSQLPIDTKDGQIALPATAREEKVDGRRFVVVTANRTLIPDRPGEFTLAPITATVRKATERARSRGPFADFDDLFGGSLLGEMEGRGQPTRTALARAEGEPQKLVVKPFPTDGRPESFVGAVGSGFSIDVVADRTVVRVGDPIGLDITLRGNGNVENASLPALSADDGMNPDQFHLPEGDASGTVADGAKRFHVSVRVTDESVGEIPALAYSWFDPETESYQTARSKPIALRVMPAQLVSAGDVVRNKSSTDPEDGKRATTDGHGERQVAMSTPHRPAVSLNGADLAIESDADTVLRDSAGNSTFITAAMYAVGCLLVAVALVDRRRRNADPALIARRKSVRSQQDRIARAAQQPQRQAAEEIAAALRMLVAEAPNLDRDAAQAVIADCETIAYAPARGTESRLDHALVERARRIAEQAE
ncbi:MAG TPA: BatD family protein [Pirellulales bacterium]|nr:BatD family protein [Pirellulales bacterium]